MRKVAYNRGAVCFYNFKSLEKLKEYRRLKKDKEERLRKTRAELKSKIIKLDFKEGAD